MLQLTYAHSCICLVAFAYIQWNYLDFSLSFFLENPIIIEKGTFSWGDDDNEDNTGDEKKKEDVTLSNLNLTVKKGSLVAVVGSVGAGKSSLCSAILGEMNKHSGTVHVNVSFL